MTTPPFGRPHALSASTLLSGLVLATLAAACSTNDLGPNPLAADMAAQSDSDPSPSADIGQSGADQDPLTDSGPAPQPCNGCVSPLNGACFSGTTRDACGSGGVMCKMCDASAGEVCDEVDCVPPPGCNPDNCLGCCDADGVCVETSSDAVCGQGGSECQDCGASGASCTEEGLCAAPCGPETCAGCCDGSGACVSGDSDSVCGGGGLACGACEADEECEVTSSSGDVTAGQCVNKGCSQTCAGCCAGDQCLTGDLDEACGAGGAPCQDCGSGSLCNGSSLCEARPQVTWTLVLLQGTFPQHKPNGDDWDGFIGKLPDPFVTAKYDDPVTGNKESKKSNEEDNTLTPNWQGEVLFAGITAEAVRSNLRFDYTDDDVAFNDTLGEDCTLDNVNVLFDSAPHLVTCGEERDASGSVTYAGGTFSVRLDQD